VYKSTFYLGSFDQKNQRTDEKIILSETVRVKFLINLLFIFLNLLICQFACKILLWSAKTREGNVLVFNEGNSLSVYFQYLYFIPYQ
jgi:hypothetical protein